MSDKGLTEVHELNLLRLRGLTQLTDADEKRRQIQAIEEDSGLDTALQEAKETLNTVTQNALKQIHGAEWLLSHQEII